MSDQQDDHDPLIDLQGRIIALELMMRAWLAGEALKKPDPVSSLRETKSALYTSLQGIDRPYDEVSDAIWSQAIEALDLLFEQAEFRVKTLME
jgi:hypothetical protein